jgi:flagellar biosynthesis protein FlhG
VTSGKGGVGKTFFSANLAAALARRGERVLVLDADLGLANLDVVLNLHPKLTLHDVFTGKASLDEAILPRRAASRCLLAGSGLVEYSRLTPQVREQLVEIIDQVAPRFDRILLDTGAGISDVVLHAISLADDVLVIATPEPTSMTDAYATIKLLAIQQDRRTIKVVVNQVSMTGEGRRIRNQLQLVIRPVRLPAPERRQQRRGVARPAGRDPDRLVGARSGAAAHLAARAHAGRRGGARRRRDRGPDGALAALDSARRGGLVARLEQDDERAVTAVGGPRVREREDLAPLHQPRLHFRLQHGLATRRPEALAVDDANAAQPGARPSRAGRP